MSYSFLLKLIVIGDSGVGKSCLLLQYTDHKYRDKHQVTIGVQFGSKLININGNVIKLQIWDTAGQQSFKAITRGYYRNAIGAIICYDVSNRDSFNHVIKWLEQAQSNSSSTLHFIIVGTKNDKQNERKITYQEGQKLSQQYNIPFIECSAKTGTNIDQIFLKLSTGILKSIQQNYDKIKTHSGIKIGNNKFINNPQINTIQHLNNKKNDKLTNKKCCK